MLFGKLPRHGDFVARGLAPTAREAWDGWASAGLERAGAALGERFGDAHDAAAPWRFVARPEGFGEAWLAGALAPSVDAVGRRFVILLAVQGLTAEEAVAQGALLSARLEEVIYRCFSEGLDADAAVAAADRVLDHGAPAAVAASVDASNGAWWAVGYDGAPAAVIAGHDPPRDLFARAFALGQAVP
ncbi:MAG TPA: type VI secretion system-associated protein TagF [Caulobacteraceae bacterium]|nr:type VI secretion system-associated protein TagF [Caulobacteraceae bacterium]